MKLVIYIIGAFLFLSACASTYTIDNHSSYPKENRSKSEVVVTASGLQYEVLREGSGLKPKSDSKVTLHYVGKNIDGSEFDNTYKRGAPPSFVLSGVIPGLVEGVQEMKMGSKYRFIVPAELAYGDRGAGAVIKPGSTLIYEVELLNIE